jgi:hypothetical protein
LRKEIVEKYCKTHDQLEKNLEANN